MKSMYDSELRRLKTKIIRLEEKQTANKKIKDIKYFCTVNKIGAIPETKKFSFKKPSSEGDCSDVFETNLTPSIYKYKYNFQELKKNWFINLSQKNIPNEIQFLLQLGEGFSLPPQNAELTIIEFIKHIENNIFRLRIPNIRGLRNRAFPLLMRAKNNIKLRDGMHDSLISSSLTATKRFINDNPEILFTRADKGNTVVALKKIDYTQQMEHILSDENTYTLLKRNPSNNIVTNLKTLLKKWKRLDVVTVPTYNKLNSSNPTLPRAYGLPKIHKPGTPLRIIISSIGSPLHNLAAFLHEIIHNSLPPSESYIKNSFQLANRVSNLSVPLDSTLVSLDVVSLFTNVPVDLVISGLERRWELIQRKTSLPKSEFIEGIKLVLESTFFTFNGNYYRQTFGVPMGSPLSPIVADLVLQDLESNCLNLLTTMPDFYFRYVDDIVLSTHHSRIDTILNTFNSYHPRLKFTVEVGGDQINFLDITIIRRNGSLIYDWYQKPTFSSRFLNFYSYHPFCHKKGTILGLIDRVLKLSHPSFHQKNFDKIINILLMNGYPLDIIFDNINNRLHTHFQKLNNTINITEQKVTKEARFFTIPFVNTSQKDLRKRSRMSPMFVWLTQF